MFRRSHRLLSACLERATTATCAFPCSCRRRLQAVNVPVLTFLSGLTCTEENFMVKSGAQRVAAELGLMLVSPDTSPRGADVPDDPDDDYDFGLGAGFYVNATAAPWSQHYHMYDYITRNCPTSSSSNFPGDAERQGLTGHSMGGHGALTIGLRNSERYRSLSAFAPICTTLHSPWGKKALGHYLGNDVELAGTITTPVRWRAAAAM